MSAVREFHWQVTGWKATVLGLVIVSIPVAFIFAAGFCAGRML